VDTLSSGGRLSHTAGGPEVSRPSARGSLSGPPVGCHAKLGRPHGSPPSRGETCARQEHNATPNDCTHSCEAVRVCTEHHSTNTECPHKCEAVRTCKEHHTTNQGCPHTCEAARVCTEHRGINKDCPP
jgi:hypothetical protein